jgi:formate dehydrogenase subunit gamma
VRRRELRVEAAASSTDSQGLSQAEIAAVCERHGNRPDALIEILHEIQERAGWIDAQAPASIASALNLSRADVHGVVSFYHDFRREPPARVTLRLCRAEACQAVGCEALAAQLEERLGVQTGETRADRAVRLEAVYCLGNCALGPAALIEGELFGRASAEGLVREVETRCASGRGAEARS